jgi:hypothetical protein
VYPDPYPSSCGRCIHAIPVCSTNKIPDNASRSGNRLRPGYLARRGLRGNNGSTSSHNSSGTTQGELAAIDTPPSLTTDADVLRRQRTGPSITVRALTWSKRSRGEARSSGCPRGLEQRCVRSSDGGSD